MLTNKTADLRVWRSRSAAAVLALGAGLLLAGCGDDAAEAPRDDVDAGYAASDDTATDDAASDDAATDTPQVDPDSANFQFGDCVPDECEWTGVLGGWVGHTVYDALAAGELNATLSGTGENAFVTGIGGHEANPDNNEFWAFYVNGESSMLGVGSVVIEEGDEISFRLTTW